MSLVPGDMAMSAMRVDFWSSPTKKADYVLTSTPGEVVMVIGVCRYDGDGAYWVCALGSNGRFLAWTYDKYLVKVK